MNISNISIIDFPLEKLVNYTKQQQKFLIQRIQNIELYELTYYVGKLMVKGYMLVPKNIDTSSPCIIYNRGGAREVGLIDYRLLFGDLSVWASRGYIVIASQYTGNGGSEGKDELSGMDLNSLTILSKVVNEYHYIDKNRIGMVGWSRGGLMSLNVMRKAKSVDWLKAVSIVNPLVDINSIYIQRPKLKEFYSDMYDIHSIEENNIRSPIHNISEITKDIPLQIIQGGNDDRVSPPATLEFVQKLLSAGHKSLDFHFYSQEDHYFTDNIHTVDHLQIDFFRQHLNLPDIKP